MVEERRQLKTALPIMGSLYVEITFNLLEKKGNFYSSGQSGFYNDVRKNRKRMLENAIYNAYKKEFPSGTYTMVNIVILYYHYNYFFHRFTIINKDNKEYYRFRESKKDRTHYYRLNDKWDYAPDSSYNGIYKDKK